jgi:excisionase family DNA binding protein
MGMDCLWGERSEELLGVRELILILICLVALIVMAVGVAVLIMRRTSAAGDSRRLRDQDTSLVMSVDEIATLLRTDVSTVQELIRDGRLPAVRVGEDWRVSRANVIAFLNAGEQGS